MIRLLRGEKDSCHSIPVSDPSTAVFVEGESLWAITRAGYTLVQSQEHLDQLRADETEAADSLAFHADHREMNHKQHVNDVNTLMSKNVPVAAAVKKAVDPSHYQGYIQELQWLEAMQYLPNMREPAHFKAALELQIRKYLDRNGGKDCELQELSKALWYHRFLVAYVKNGDKPIRVKDIPAILES